MIVRAGFVFDGEDGGAVKVRVGEEGFAGMRMTDEGRLSAPDSSRRVMKS